MSEPATESAAAGLLAELLGESGRADPYPLYAAMHELGKAAEAGPGLVIAFGYDVVNAMLRDPSYLVTDAARLDEVYPVWRDHPSLEADSLLNLNPPHHARIRSLVTGAFTARRVAGLQATVRLVAAQLIAGLADRGAATGAPVDFMADFAYQLPVTVICELLGVPEADRAEFRPVARDLAAAVEPIDDMAVLAAADTAAIWMQDYFGQLVAQRRARPGADLISALLQATPDSLTQTELLSNLTLLLVAGFETTTNLLGNGLHILLTMPAVAAGLRDGSLTPGAFVTEVLRYDSPVQATTRWRLEPTEIGGVPVPARGEVVALTAAANRDPAKFAEPDRFQARRTEAGPLSFGAGAHFCVGAALARLEATIAFPLLLSSLPALAPAGQPVRRDRLVLRGFDQLPVTVR